MAVYAMTRRQWASALMQSFFGTKQTKVKKETAGRGPIRWVLVDLGAIETRGAPVLVDEVTCLTKSEARTMFKNSAGRADGRLPIGLVVVRHWDRNAQVAKILRAKMKGRERAAA